MLGAIGRLFRKSSKLQSVGVYYIGADLYICTEYGSDGSDPCYVVGSVRRVPITAGAAAVGSAISEGLSACRYDFRAPQTRDEWKSVEFPIFKATGLKSWAAVAKRANSLAVRRLDSTVNVLPSMREKQGFFPVAERVLALEAPSDTQLGEAVIAELQRTRSIEGPA